MLNITLKWYFSLDKRWNWIPYWFDWKRFVKWFVWERCHGQHQAQISEIHQTWRKAYFDYRIHSSMDWISPYLHERWTHHCFRIRSIPIDSSKNHFNFASWFFRVGHCKPSPNLWWNDIIFIPWTQWIRKVNFFRFYPNSCLCLIRLIVYHLIPLLINLWNNSKVWWSIESLGRYNYNG